MGRNKANADAGSQFRHLLSSRLVIKANKKLEWIIFDKISFAEYWDLKVSVRDFVPFAQFKKREKHKWRSVTFIKVATLLSLVPNRAMHHNGFNKKHITVSVFV